MSDTTARTAANLALLDTETQRLLRTVDAIPAPGLARPTLCEGWDTAHLLTHIARNADALTNLVRWAADGKEREAYASEEVREQEIESGAARSHAQIVADVHETARVFRSEAEQLLGPAGEATVRTRTGNEVKGAQVISMRIIEVIFHHVDLATGFQFDEVDRGWVIRNLRRGAASWERAGAPPLTLEADGMEPLQINGGGQVVRGTPGLLLQWLARGIEHGLSSDAALPEPPTWG